MDVSGFRELLTQKRVKHASKVKPELAQRDVTVRTEDLYSTEHENFLVAKSASQNAKVVQAIDGAIGRLSMGTYGICRDCGGEIAEKRLRAVPWTRVCITCKVKAGDK